MLYRLWIVLSALIASALAVDVTQNTVVRGQITVELSGANVFPGVYLSIVDNYLLNCVGNVKVGVGGGLYISSNSNMFALRVTFLGGIFSIENDGIISLNAMRSMVSPSYALLASSFVNNGEFYMAGDDTLGVPVYELQSLTWANNGLVVISQKDPSEALASLGATGTTINNAGTVCIRNVYYRQTTGIMGSGCFVLQEAGIFQVPNALLVFGRGQSIFMEDEQSQIIVQALSTAQTFRVYNFGNNNRIALTAYLLPTLVFPAWTYEASTGILTLRSMALSQRFIIGSGYNPSLFVADTHGIRYTGRPPSSTRPAACRPCKEVPDGPGSQPTEYETSVVVTNTRSRTYTRSAVVKITTDENVKWYTTTSYYPWTSTEQVTTYVTQYPTTDSAGVLLTESALVAVQESEDELYTSSSLYPRHYATRYTTTNSIGENVQVLVTPNQNNVWTTSLSTIPQYFTEYTSTMQVMSNGVTSPDAVHVIVTTNEEGRWTTIVSDIPEDFLLYTTVYFTRIDGNPTLVSREVMVTTDSNGHWYTTTQPLSPSFTEATLQVTSVSNGMMVVQTVVQVVTTNEAGEWTTFRRSIAAQATSYRTTYLTTDDQANLETAIAQIFISTDENGVWHTSSFIEQFTTYTTTFVGTDTLGATGTFTGVVVVTTDQDSLWFATTSTIPRTPTLYTTIIESTDEGMSAATDLYEILITTNEDGRWTTQTRHIEPEATEFTMVVSEDGKAVTYAALVSSDAEGNWFTSIREVDPLYTSYTTVFESNSDLVTALVIRSTDRFGELYTSTIIQEPLTFTQYTQLYTTMNSLGYVETRVGEFIVTTDDRGVWTTQVTDPSPTATGYILPWVITNSNGDVISEQHSILVRTNVYGNWFTGVYKMWTTSHTETILITTTNPDGSSTVATVHEILTTDESSSWYTSTTTKVDEATEYTSLYFETSTNGQVQPTSVFNILVTTDAEGNFGTATNNIDANTRFTTQYEVPDPSGFTETINLEVLVTSNAESGWVTQFSRLSWVTMSSYTTTFETTDPDGATATDSAYVEIVMDLESSTTTISSVYPRPTPTVTGETEEVSTTTEASLSINAGAYYTFYYTTYTTTTDESSEVVETAYVEISADESGQVVTSTSVLTNGESVIDETSLEEVTSYYTTYTTTTDESSEVVETAYVEISADESGQVVTSTSVLTNGESVIDETSLEEVTSYYTTYTTTTDESSEVVETAYVEISADESGQVVTSTSVLTNGESVIDETSLEEVTSYYTTYTTTTDESSEVVETAYVEISADESGQVVTSTSVLAAGASELSEEETINGAELTMETLAESIYESFDTVETEEVTSYYTTYTTATDESSEVVETAYVEISADESGQVVTSTSVLTNGESVIDETSLEEVTSYYTTYTTTTDESSEVVETAYVEISADESGQVVTSTSVLTNGESVIDETSLEEVTSYYTTYTTTTDESSEVVETAYVEISADESGQVVTSTSVLTNGESVIDETSLEEVTSYYTTYTTTTDESSEVVETAYVEISADESGQVVTSTSVLAAGASELSEEETINGAELTMETLAESIYESFDTVETEEVTSYYTTYTTATDESSEVVETAYVEISADESGQVVTSTSVLTNGESVIDETSLEEVTSYYTTYTTTTDESSEVVETAYVEISADESGQVVTSTSVLTNGESVIDETSLEEVTSYYTTYTTTTDESSEVVETAYVEISADESGQVVTSTSVLAAGASELSEEETINGAELTMETLAESIYESFDTVETEISSRQAESLDFLASLSESEEGHVLTSYHSTYEATKSSEPFGGASVIVIVDENGVTSTTSIIESLTDESSGDGESTKSINVETVDTISSMESASVGVAGGYLVTSSYIIVYSFIEITAQGLESAYVEVVVDNDGATTTSSSIIGRSTISIGPDETETVSDAFDSSLEESMEESTEEATPTSDNGFHVTSYFTTYSFSESSEEGLESAYVAVSVNNGGATTTRTSILGRSTVDHLSTGLTESGYGSDIPWEETDSALTTESFTTPERTNVATGSYITSYVTSYSFFELSEQGLESGFESGFESGSVSGLESAYVVVRLDGYGDTRTSSSIIGRSTITGVAQETSSELDLTSMAALASYFTTYTVIESGYEVLETAYVEVNTNESGSTLTTPSILKHSSSITDGDGSETTEELKNSTEFGDFESSITGFGETTLEVSEMSAYWESESVDSQPGYGSGLEPTSSDSIDDNDDDNIRYKSSITEAESFESEMGTEIETEAETVNNSAESVYESGTEILTSGEFLSSYVSGTSSGQGGQSYGFNWSSHGENGLTSGVTSTSNPSASDDTTQSQHSDGGGDFSESHESSIDENLESTLSEQLVETQESGFDSESFGWFSPSDEAAASTAGFEGESQTDDWSSTQVDEQTFSIFTTTDENGDRSTVVVEIFETTHSDGQVLTTSDEVSADFTTFIVSQTLSEDTMLFTQAVYVIITTDSDGEWQTHFLVDEASYSLLPGQVTLTSPAVQESMGTEDSLATPSDAQFVTVLSTTDELGEPTMALVEISEVTDENGSVGTTTTYPVPPVETAMTIPWVQSYESTTITQGVYVVITTDSDGNWTTRFSIDKLFTSIEQAMTVYVSIDILGEPKTTKLLEISKVTDENGSVSTTTSYPDVSASTTVVVPWISSDESTTITQSVHVVIGTDSNGEWVTSFSIDAALPSSTDAHSIGITIHTETSIVVFTSIDSLESPTTILGAVSEVTDANGSIVTTTSPFPMAFTSIIVPWIDSEPSGAAVTQAMHVVVTTDPDGEWTTVFSIDESRYSLLPDGFAASSVDSGVAYSGAAAGPSATSSSISESQNTSQEAGATFFSLPDSVSGEVDYGETLSPDESTWRQSSSPSDWPIVESPNVERSSSLSGVLLSEIFGGEGTSVADPVDVESETQVDDGDFNNANSKKIPGFLVLLSSLLHLLVQ
ncbi:uncharacterized protein LODBEIA_P40280 [Lodderomyces beijingensis]|uniref:Hyphally-regulated cell wall protein N-terminal domain-containing protein n=1 Tax=Lodderomyces beijingensis TaxID=1775926 RepID=A0ABP0ZNT0_9ASCO